MSPHGITDPPDQSSRNSRNKFRLSSLQTVTNFVVLGQKVRKISVVEKMLPGKVGHHRCPDLLQTDTPYPSLYDTM